MEYHPRHIHPAILEMVCLSLQIKARRKISQKAFQWRWNSWCLEQNHKAGCAWWLEKKLILNDQTRVPVSKQKRHITRTSLKYHPLRIITLFVSIFFSNETSKTKSIIARVEDFLSKNLIFLCLNSFFKNSWYIWVHDKIK